MASRIITKKGSGAPLASDLVHGELAVDTVNKRLYTENAGGTVIEVGTNPSTIDINAGTIDGTVIGGSSAAAITGTTITGTSFVSSGDMTFGDNDKAVFGAGSDLQIYHDGTDSYITDTTGGNLFINEEGAGYLMMKGSDLYFRNPSNADMIHAQSGGYVKLYHNGSEKLATTSTGIDVTGTAVVDGLTSSGTILGSAASGGFIKLKRDDTTLTNNADVGAIDFETTDTDDAGVAATILASGDGSAGGVKLRFYTGTASDKNERLLINANGDISFYEDTGTTAKFFWDASAESLGIGTTSPSVDGIDIVKGTGTSTYVRTSDGTVTSLAGVAPALGGGLIGTTSNHPMLFYANNAERMRIDSSGNLLVGKTTTAFATEGAVINNNGSFEVTKDGGATLFLNRKTSDGAIALFYKDGTTVGSIGASGGDLYIGTGDTALRFLDASDFIYPISTSTGTARDNAIDLGYSTGRFKDLYLSGGVYLGGTGAANKLDDYEEGTWTPSFTVGTHTYTTQLGNYVKVGDIVYITGQLKVSVVDSSVDASTVTIQGLPFTVSSTNTGMYGQISTHDHSNITYPTGRTSIGFYTQIGNTRLICLAAGDNVVANSLTYANWNDNGVIYFSGCYIAA